MATPFTPQDPMRPFPSFSGATTYTYIPTPDPPNPYQPQPQQNPKQQHPQHPPPPPTPPMHAPMGMGGPPFAGPPFAGPPGPPGMSYGYGPWGMGPGAGPGMGMGMGMPMSPWPGHQHAANAGWNASPYPPPWWNAWNQPQPPAMKPPGEPAGKGAAGKGKEKEGQKKEGDAGSGGNAGESTENQKKNEHGEGSSGQPSNTSFPVPPAPPAPPMTPVTPMMPGQPFPFQQYPPMSMPHCFPQQQQQVTNNPPTENPTPGTSSAQDPGYALTFPGNSTAQIQARNAWLAETQGANGVFELVPKNVKPSQLLWCQELEQDGLGLQWSLRTQSDIENNCKPGRWVGTSWGNIMWVRTT